VTSTCDKQILMKLKEETDMLIIMMEGLNMLSAVDRSGE
jgi:hypothetical protein